MRARRLATALLAAVSLTCASAGASEWGTIVPATTTRAAVTAYYGAPTRTVDQKVDGYDTVQCIYEGAQAPVGMRRLVVDFGLLTPSGYRPELVRTFRLEPKPAVFNRPTVLNAWGEPTSVGKEGETPVFFYHEGLLVYFDKEGWNAEVMIFTPPQPPPPASTPAPR